VDISIIANVGPTANAGLDQTVAGLSSVSLTGAASTDGDNDTLTYAWVQVSGPVVTLTGDTTATPGFVAPQRALVAQTLVFELTVGDGFSTANDQVTVTVPANIAPVANAGADQNTTGGASVTLDGSGSSDAESDPITYSWTQSAGPAVTLSAATSASPSFTAPAKTNAIQTLTFDLVVNDGAASSAVDQVSVSVAANVGPTANAGPDQTVAGLSSVSLTGAASTDGDNDTLTYAWVQVSGPAVALSGASTASPTFTAPAKTANAQTLVFELTVSDGLLAGIDTVLVSVAPNMAPLANAGADQSVAGQSSVTLDGSGSTDPDGDTLTYSWTQTAGPVVTLSDASAVSPVFTAPRGQASATTLTFTLSVSDGVVSTTDTIDVVIAPNNPPVANAGADLGPIDSGQTVTLNGSASTDPDSDPLTYAWSQVSGTAVTLAGANSATPSFVAPLVNGFEDLVFELIVNDGQVASQPDRVAVTIRAVGQITIVQRVIGADRQFVFTSSVASLSATVQTSGGVGQIQAQQVPAGRYTVSGPDLTAAGYALTALACNDSDSIVDLANRSVALVLSPNEELVCTYTSADTRTAAQTAITDFLGVRGAALLSHQPDLQRRLDRLEGRTPVGGQVTVGGFAVPGMSGLPVSLALADGQARFSTSLSALRATPSEGGSVTGPDIDVWAEGYFSSLDYAGHEGDFALIYVGGDVRVGQNVLIGVLAQFDTFERTGALTPGAAEGDGWMAGPYVTVRLGESVYADARIAWGESDNTVSPLGTWTDGFSTSRTLYAGSLVGRVNWGEGVVFQPELELRYLMEEQDAYTDTQNVRIPGQSVDIGEISFRPRIEKAFAFDNGWSLRPFGIVEGIYTFGTPDGSIIEDGVRARFEAGADLYSEGGLRLSLSGFHDAGGNSAFEATGWRIGISLGR
jgi:hypothetical protein